MVNLHPPIEPFWDYIKYLILVLGLEWTSKMWNKLDNPKVFGIKQSFLILFTWCIEIKPDDLSQNDFFVISLNQNTLKTQFLILWWLNFYENFFVQTFFM